MMAKEFEEKVFSEFKEDISKEYKEFTKKMLHKKKKELFRDAGKIYHIHCLYSFLQREASSIFDINDVAIIHIKGMRNCLLNSIYLEWLQSDTFSLETDEDIKQFVIEWISPMREEAKNVSKC